MKLDRINHNNAQKIIFIITLVFFISSRSFSETNEKGSLSFEGTGIFINDINLNWSSLKRGYRFNGKLKTFELGFKRTEIDFIDKTDKRAFRLDFQGPDLSFLGLSISFNTRSPDWIHNTRSRFRSQYQKPALDGLNTLSKAIDSYTISENMKPDNLEDLISKKYINLSTYPFNDRRVSFSLGESGTISANLPSRSKSRSAQTIYFDTKTGDLTGDYIPLTTADTIAWEYSLDIKEISQTFSSEASLEFIKDSSKFQFLQKKGRFKISGVNLKAIPDSDINDLAHFRLNDIVLETSNINLFGIVRDSIPKIDHARGHFTMRNVDINIPTSMTEDIEINYFLEQLGIWNGVFKIRLIDFEINLLSSRLGEIRARFQTPFLNISLDGDLSLIQGRDAPQIFFQQTEVMIKPISLGVRNTIRKWEKDNDIDLPRKNGVIMLKISGPVLRPQIDGVIY